MTDNNLISLIDEDILDLVNIHIWPQRNQIDPLGWIENFSKEDLDIANQLLKRFLFYPKHMTEQMFVSNFQSLSKYIISDKSDYQNGIKEWEFFLENSFIIRVTGENPSDADSGFIFTRLARNLLKYNEEEQILSPERAIDVLNNNKDEKKLFIFVDDFVGSGSQFMEFWQRPYNESLSFDLLSKESNSEFFYIPLIVTEYGKERINTEAPEVILQACHILEEKDCILRPDSYIWKEARFNSEDAVNRIYEISKGIGIQIDASQTQVNPDGSKNVVWYGHAGLGLALAFDHGYPDATIPLFYHDKGTWKPLLK